QVDEDQDCHVLVDGIIAQRFGDDDIQSLEEAFIEKTGVYEKILNFISEAKWTLDWYDIRVEHNLITTSPVTTSPDMVIAPNPETLNTNFVIDEAGLLTESQRQGLQATLAEIDKRLDVNVVVVTVNSTGDKTAEAYADDYYDYHNFKNDGILLLINMGKREYHFSTAGFGIEAINDDGLTLLENKIVPYLSNGNYAGAFGEFASQCDSLFTQARNGDPYVEPTPVKERTSLISVLTGTAPISAILGFLMAKLKVGGLKNQLKTVKGRYEANSYVRNQSLNLTENRDIFLYNVITKTPRPNLPTRISIADWPARIWSLPRTRWDMA
ncbi:MAG: TPM domain-containing protein, partial [Enterococcus sp.]|nr:TPM domain-containing protein [Enterococcus sp.]